jgi:hypothetical protein
MTKPKPTNTTTRRHLLTIAAGGAVAAAIPADIRAYPGHAADPIFAAIEAHRKANAVEQAAWDEVNRLHELADEKISPSDEHALTDGPNAEAFDAQKEFAGTVPTTIPGLLAMIVYASELDDQDPEVFSDCRETLATAAQALMASALAQVQS